MQRYDLVMAAIQVRDVPEPVYRKLSELARKEHRSLAQQTLMVISRGLGLEVDAKTRRRNLLALLGSEPPAGKKRVSDPAKLIREDRRR